VYQDYKASANFSLVIGTVAQGESCFVMMKLPAFRILSQSIKLGDFGGLGVANPGAPASPGQAARLEVG
jgi:hypothetical protein